MNRQNQLELFKLMTGHKIKDRPDEAFLDITAESDGTRRLIDLLPALHLLLRSGGVCIIDEFDRSLHPIISFKIIELFLNNQTGLDSQLIVTTHESGLLNLNLLRRDEIWFVEKNKDGASSLYSLEEFVPRYDSDVGKGYLHGRFGAIPVVGDISKLGWTA